MRLEKILRDYEWLLRQLKNNIPDDEEDDEDV